MPLIATKKISYHLILPSRNEISKIMRKFVKFIKRTINK